MNQLFVLKDVNDEVTNWRDEIAGIPEELWEKRIDVCSVKGHYECLRNILELSEMKN